MSNRQPANSESGRAKDFQRFGLGRQGNQARRAWMSDDAIVEESYYEEDLQKVVDSEEQDRSRVDEKRLENERRMRAKNKRFRAKQVEKHGLHEVEYGDGTKAKMMAIQWLQNPKKKSCCGIMDLFAILCFIILLTIFLVIQFPFGLIFLVVARCSHKDGVIDKNNTRYWLSKIAVILQPIGWAVFFLIFWESQDWPEGQGKLKYIERSAFVAAVAFSVMGVASAFGNHGIRMMGFFCAPIKCMAGVFNKQVGADTRKGEEEMSKRKVGSDAKVLLWFGQNVFMFRMDTLLKIADNVTRPRAMYFKWSMWVMSSLMVGAMSHYLFWYFTPILHPTTPRPAVTPTVAEHVGKVFVNLGAVWIPSQMIIWCICQVWDSRIRSSCLLKGVAKFFGVEKDNSLDNSWLGTALKQEKRRQQKEKAQEVDTDSESEELMRTGCWKWVCCPCLALQKIGYKCGCGEEEDYDKHSLWPCTDEDCCDPCKVTGCCSVLTCCAKKTDHEDLSHPLPRESISVI